MSDQNGKDSSKKEPPKENIPKKDPPKNDPPKNQHPKENTPKTGPARGSISKTQHLQEHSPKTEPAKPNTSKAGPARGSISKNQHPKDSSSPPNKEPARGSISKTQHPKEHLPNKNEPAKSNTSKAGPARGSISKNQHPQENPLKQEHPKQEPVKHESPKEETHKKEPSKPEHLTQTASNEDTHKEHSKQDHPKDEFKNEPSKHDHHKEESKNEFVKHEHPHEEPLKHEPHNEEPKKELSIQQHSKDGNSKRDLPKASYGANLTSANRSATRGKVREVIKIRLKVKRDTIHPQQKHGSDSSIHSRKSVHFRDGRKHDQNYGDDESMRDVEVSVSSVAKGLVDVAYFETLMRDKEPWVDHNYISGFRNIFSADEVWLEEIYCIPCGLNTTYQITTKDEPVFYVKKTQTVFSTWFKSLVCYPTPCCRNGFKVKVYNPGGARLLTFIRKSHMFVKQSDIVEAFYGKEDMYIGRIERSAHGYILRDKYHEDIYRVLQLPTSKRSFSRMSARSKDLFEGIVPKMDDGTCCSIRQKEMKIFRSDTKEVVGRIAYLKKGPGRRFFNGCSVQPKLGFFCHPDMGTNAKVLLVGVLFFLMHSGHERHVDFPTGSDAAGHGVVASSNTSVTSSNLDNKALSDASLDLLMKK